MASEAWWESWTGETWGKGPGPVFSQSHCWKRRRRNACHVCGVSASFYELSSFSCAPSGQSLFLVLLYPEPMDSQDACQGQVWRRVGTWGLASWISWLWHRMTGPTRGKGWIPLGCSWGSGKGAWRKGRVGRWCMARIATSRMPSVRGVWIWSWLPGIGIPHVQMFPLAQELRKETGVSRWPVTLTPHTRILKREMLTLDKVIWYCKKIIGRNGKRKIFHSQL